MKINHKSTIFTKVKYNLKYNLKDGGHVKYIASRGEKDLKHIGYMSDRPRSTGLFGSNPDRPPSLKEGISLAEDKESTVSWRLIISLREDDAKLLGYTERKDWEELTRRCMQQFSRAIDIDESRLKWLAAFHKEPGHPHVHILAWPEGIKRRGNLTEKEMREYRRGVAREILGEYRRELAIEKTAARNAMLDSVKESIRDMEKKIELEMQIRDPVGEKFPPRFNKEDLENLYQRLAVLAEKMPGSGRTALKYMPQEVKDEVKKIADYVINKPQMKESLEKMESSVRRMTRIYTYSEERSEQAWQNAYNDLQDRVANILLQKAANIQQKSRKNVFERENISRSAYRTVFRTIDRERLRTEAQAELASLRAEERSRQREEIKKKREMGIEIAY